MKRLSVRTIICLSALCLLLSFHTGFCDEENRDPLKGPSVETTLKFLNKVFNPEDFTYSYNDACKEKKVLAGKPSFRINPEGKNECELEISYDTFDLSLEGKNSLDYCHYVDQANMATTRLDIDKDYGGYMIRGKDTDSLKRIIHKTTWYGTRYVNNGVSHIYGKKESSLLDLTREFTLNNTSPHRDQHKSNLTCNLIDIPSPEYRDKVQRALEHLHAYCAAKYPVDEDPF